MNGKAIREEIDRNYEQIDCLLDTAIFTLNEQVVLLRQRNDYLRSVCPHEYNARGLCLYCDKEKEVK